MGARVAVAGASGYAGGELLRLLAGHPDLEIGAVTAGSHAGQPVGQVHPHLVGVPSLAGRVFEPADAAVTADCDLLFLALPAGQSALLAARLDSGIKVVDLGPDFRLADADAWARHYDVPYAGRWTTGLPELPGAREQIAAASRVAVPGCYATAAIVALTPLIAAGLAEPRDVVVVAASGTSGAGRSPRTDLLASEVMGAVSAYQGGGRHRHTPEIEQALAEAVRLAAPGHPAGQPAATVGFTPLLAPMPRGILAACTALLAAALPAAAAALPAAALPAAAAAPPAAAPPAAAPPTGPALPRTAAVRAALARAYEQEPFVHLLPEGRWPSTASVAGSNGVHLQAAADPRTGRVTVTAAIDNLGKGAAGQALQNANLMLGLAETAGLSAAGVAP